MKKLSLVLLGALAVTQAAQAAPASFNGFYVGGQLGWTQRKDTTNLTTRRNFTRPEEDCITTL